MFERILVPLDGSSLAEQVLPYVTELAGKMGSQMVLLTACCRDDPLRHMFASYLSEKAQHLQSQGIRAQSELVQGEPADRILDFAEANGVGLIAICTHGESGASSWPLGSIAHKVVLKSHIPVLLVRANGDTVFQEKDSYRVLVPLDGSPVAESILPYVKSMAAGMCCEVFLLRIAEPVRLPRVGSYATGFKTRQYEHDQRELIDSAKKVATHYLAEREEELAGKGLKTQTACLLGKPADCILRYADDESVDMIALATHGFSGISKWAFGSVASRVVEGASQPVLLVRPPLPSPERRSFASMDKSHRKGGAPDLVHIMPSSELALGEATSTATRKTL